MQPKIKPKLSQNLFGFENITVRAPERVGKSPDTQQK